MNIFRTQMFQSLTLAQGAALALKHRLYVSGWQLSYILQILKTSQNSQNRIVIGFLDDVPVAVAVLNHNNICAFCRKQHRRNGYAGACVRALRAHNASAGTGIVGSANFWHKMGVECMY
jgi:hypothetical protein